MTVAKIKSMETWAPVWKHSNVFNLHPIVIRYEEKPPDDDNVYWVKVRIVPLSPRPKKKAKGGKAR